MSADLQKIGRVIDNRIIEFFDGYAVVGFINGEPVILRHTPDAKTHIAVNALLMAAAEEPLPGGKDVRDPN